MGMSRIFRFRIASIFLFFLVLGLFFCNFYGFVILSYRFWLLSTSQVTHFPASHGFAFSVFSDLALGKSCWVWCFCNFYGSVILTYRF